MNLSGRSLIITLVILALLLVGLISYLAYSIFNLQQPAADPDSATIFLVDSSIRMGDPLGEGNTTKLENAQQIVSQAVNRLPETEVVSVHVFGSGVVPAGCEDSVNLVPVGQRNGSQVVSQVNSLRPGAEDAALVKAAIEAVEDLGKSGFAGAATLVIVTGGIGTCGLDDGLITRAANPYPIELTIRPIFISSDREAEGFTFSNNISGSEISVANPDDIAGVVEEIISGNTPAPPPILDVETATPTETPVAPILETDFETETPTEAPAQLETAQPTESSVEPEATPTEEPDEPTPTRGIPTLNPPTQTIDPNATPTAIPTPTETPTGPIETPEPTNTAIPATSTNTPVPGNTDTPVPNTPTQETPNEPTSRLSIVDISVGESEGSVFVVVSRTSPNSKRVLVNYDSSNGSAIAGSDYFQVNGQLTWEANQGGEQTIKVDIIDDQVLEPSEAFNIQLSGAVNAEIQDGSAVVTIQDNESGDIIINPQSISVSEGAGKTSAAITLNGSPLAPVTVGLSTTNGNLCIPESSVTLDSTNWDSGVSISVTIVDNPGSDGSGAQTCTIQTSASSSTDSSFNGINPADINITIVDNDATYVDGTCTDADNNAICDDGIRFRTIQAAINNGNSGSSPVLNIIVSSSPHQESGIVVSRGINLSGPDGTIVQAANSSDSASNRIMTINGGVTATIDNLTLENGNAGGENGGAILNNGTLNLVNITLKNNKTNGSGGAIATTGALTATGGGFDSNFSGTCGGAVFVDSSGSANISQSNVARNESGSNGGAICANGFAGVTTSSLMGNIAAGNGGVLFVNAGGSVEPFIDSSTVSNNRANNGGAIYINNGSKARTSGATYSYNQAAGGAGGAIYAVGDFTTWNVTISGNQSSNGGAGIENQSGITNIFNSTIAFNTSLAGTPSGVSGLASVFNSIIDGNVGGDCTGSLKVFYALIGSVADSCVITEIEDSVNQINKSAGLGSLKNNGGDTETHLPANPGNAIETGWPKDKGCEGADQRGNPRPNNDAPCDIGAVER